MASRADDPLSQSAEDQARPTESNAPLAVDESEELTVVGKSPAMEAVEFPEGLSPRELAVTLKGSLLGHFHLQEFIGGGGMGAVFKALDTTLDRIVAVKVVASEQISTEDLQRRFLVEAQSTARLDHPNIARIHYVGRDRGIPFIVFEYIDGINLRDLVIHHGPVPLGDALSYATQIAHALAHAWQKEVVHRDIKPSNILVNREGQAKLVDMGLARVHHLAATDDELTNSGVTLGTFDYISPEQARDPRDADTRSDIYSLGCTLFYMLAGRAPFADGTAVQKLLQHQNQAPPNLSQLRPEVPLTVSRLVQKMLAKSPDARQQTPSELVGEFHAVFKELGLRPPASPLPLPLAPLRLTQSAWQTHLPWIIPLLVLLFATIAWSRFDAAEPDRVEFEPLRLPAEESVEQTRSTGAVETQVTTQEAVAAEGASDQVAQGAASEIVNASSRRRTRDADSARDPFTVPSSLLDFSADENLVDDETLGDASGELDLGKIFDSE